MRWLLLLMVACGHEARSVPPASGSAAERASQAPLGSPAAALPARGSAAARLQQALEAEGIHQRGDTPVDTSSLDAFARSFVAVLASGDQRAALSLLPGALWDPACATQADRPAAKELGGLFVAVPRKIRFSGVSPVGEPRTVAKGAPLDGCAVRGDTTVRVVRVTWTAPAGHATLELARARDHEWTLTAIQDP